MNVRERGIALVVTLLAMAMVSGLAVGLVLVSSSEVQIAASFRVSQEALYAADAAAEWALAELSAADDWPAVLAGTETSSLSDGEPRGTRRLVDGSTIDLSALRAANPAWRLYGYGSLQALVPADGPSSPFYLVVFVAPGEAGVEWLDVRAEAFGPRGAHRIVLVDLSRRGGATRLESWTQVH